MKLQVKKLKSNAAMVRATEGAAAYDLVATSVTPTIDGQFVIGTGIAVSIPKGYVGLLMPRSSIIKKAAYLSNSVGVIDSDYRGEVKAVFTPRHSDSPYEIGERCCQLLIVPISTPDLVFVDELDATTRGEGGFGSTGQA